MTQTLEAPANKPTYYELYGDERLTLEKLENYGEKDITFIDIEIDPDSAINQVTGVIENLPADPRCSSALATNAFSLLKGAA